MIDFGIVALFTVQLAIVFASFYVYTRVKSEITALIDLKEGIKGVTAGFDALKVDFQSVLRRQDSVEASPKALLMRFQEVEANLGKSDRLLEKIDGKVASLGGRMSAIVKGRKGRGDDDDDDDTGLAPEGEGRLPPGVGIPLGPINDDRPYNQVIPPGFGKSRRVG